MTDDLYFIEYWYHLVKPAVITTQVGCTNQPGCTTTPPCKEKNVWTNPRTQQKKQQQKNPNPPPPKKTEKKIGGGGSIFANPPSENPLVDEPS